MKVIVGLGNPGKEYERTRHNVGWWVVDHLADVWRFDGWKKDGEARVANGTVGGTKVRLIKPQTYMNLSGARAAAVPAPSVLVGGDRSDDRRRRSRAAARPLSLSRQGKRRRPQRTQEHRGAVVKSQEYSRLRIGIAPERSERGAASSRDYRARRLRQAREARSFAT